MNKKDAKLEGKDAGYASGIYGTEGFKSEEEFFSMAYESEENQRPYSPFEFLANDIDQSRYPDEVWDAYDAGVTAGIKQAWKELKKA